MNISYSQANIQVGVNGQLTWDCDYSTVGSNWAVIQAFLGWYNSGDGTYDTAGMLAIVNSWDSATDYAKSGVEDVLITQTDINTALGSIPGSSITGRLIVRFMIADNNERMFDYIDIPLSYSAASAPSSVLLAEESSAGENTTLSWSGAESGTNNTIEGYDIQRKERVSGTWGNWSDLSSVISSDTSYSISVAPPALIDNAYMYRVRTRGSAGSSFYSAYVESPAFVRGITITAPVLSIASVLSNTARLTWTASEVEGAIGTVSYNVYVDGTLYETTQDTELEIPEEATSLYETTVSITVRGVLGTYQSALSNAVSYTYEALLIPATNFRRSPSRGKQTMVAWTPGSVSSGDEVTYDLLVNDIPVVEDYAGTSYLITQDWLSNHIVKNSYAALVLVTKASGREVESDPLSFLYVDSNSTLKVRNGTDYVDCIVKVYTGDDWIDVVAKVYKDGEFIDIG